MPYKLIIVVLALLSSLASAGPDRRSSLDDAVEAARDKYQGRVVSAETQRHNGRATHNVRILTDDGQVRRYQMDAESGRRLPPRR